MKKRIQHSYSRSLILTLDTTRDLFLEDLLPPNRKLVAFDQRGTQLRIATNKQLLMWFFEDQLKGHYRNFVEALRRMSSDTIETVRGKGVSVIFQLLTSHPEQEHVSCVNCLRLNLYLNHVLC